MQILGYILIALVVAVGVWVFYKLDKISDTKDEGIG